MPRARVGDIEMGYEILGDAGAWVVLVHGLGYARWGWVRQREDFARAHRLVLCDNRGIGETDAPPGPYSIPQMADDLAGLIRALDVGPAHVVGTSLGGFIAQELALRHPSLVNRLVLVCTAAGGEDMVPMPQVTIDLMRTAGDLPVEERLRVFTENVFSAAFLQEHPEAVDEIVGYRLRTGQSFEAGKAQWDAGAAHDTSARLPDIAAPTLVITGTEDNVVDARNAKILAERIPDARLIEMPGGHLFFFEDPPTFNRHVLDFLGGRP